MIDVQNISEEVEEKNGQKKIILKDVSFVVRDGEFISLFGPNGSGKTTLLHLLAGFSVPSSGSIAIDGARVNTAQTGFVFQQYNETLLPWKTVENNIFLGLHAKEISKKHKKEMVDLWLEKVGLSQLKNRYTHELSGGQKQLVAICRALIGKPKVLLLDEPFSALDHSVSRHMLVTLLRVWEAAPVSTVCVSHDIDEAILLSDKVVIFSKNPGRVKCVIDVSLPRPRTLDLIATKEFADIRLRILEQFEYESLV